MLICDDVADHYHFVHGTMCKVDEEIVVHMPDGVTPEVMADWEWMMQQVGTFKLVFPPGIANAYHVFIWEWVLGEVVRRTDPKHQRFSVWLDEEIFTPLHVSHGLFFGASDAELSRVATLYGGNEVFLEDTYNTSLASVFPGSNAHNLKVVQQENPVLPMVTSEIMASLIEAAHHLLIVSTPRL
ncbi:hypothetical protein QQZ08_001341 [Neonectria magnoliae]|uniref:Beta-lactamase-related domain-containing protein n=1 Tax=Neonectria magnoliae TaxID=2732573 RepID=A0ABR1IFU2_9HYPO